MIRIAFSGLVLIAFLRGVEPTCNTSCQATSDQTVQEGATGKAVVTATIQKILCSWKEDVPDEFGFLQNMAAAETNNGETIGNATGNGGIWRINEENFDKVKNIMEAGSVLHGIIRENFCLNWSEKVDTRPKLDKPLYSALSVMIILYTLGHDARAKLMNSVQSQADFWVEQFNKEGNTTVFVTRANALLEKGK